MTQPKTSDDGNPAERYKRFYNSQPRWWRIWQDIWWCWEVGLSKLTGREHPVKRIIDQANEDASRESGDKTVMKMGMPSKKMIEALSRDDNDGNMISESSIVGIVPDSPDDGASSVSLVTLNQRDEFTMMIFKNADEVTVFCAGLQAASDTVFGDGDMKPMIEIPH